MRSLLRWIVFFGVFAMGLSQPLLQELVISEHSDEWGITCFGCQSHYFATEESCMMFPGSAFARIQFPSAASSDVREVESGQPGTHAKSADQTNNALEGDVYLLGKPVSRIGEASNPGPSRITNENEEDVLIVGVSNSTGMRQKEKQILDLGIGCWHFAETHLTKTTAKTCKSQLKALARQQNREVKVMTGAAASYRVNSEWAGNWTGVAQVTDLPSMPLQMNFPQEHWETARLLVTRQWCGDLPLTMATCYCYPHSPSWPLARQHNEQLLSSFTSEIVLGLQGLRVVAGDFNENPHTLQQQQIWEANGWQSVQTYAQTHWGQPRVMTCKQKTETEQIWISPEVQSILMEVGTRHVFSDHLTLWIKLKTGKLSSALWKWPRPSKIEWPEDHMPAMQAESIELTYGTATSRFRQWSEHFEERQCTMN